MLSGSVWFEVVVVKFPILDQNNDISGEIDLSDIVFGVSPKRDILARVVLWQLAKRRCGNHSTKGKSDVSRTGRKMYRQKGTGGARHGSRKAAQFRGGGIVFGPVVRSHGYSLPKAVRKLGLRMALSSKALSGSLVVVDSLRGADVVKTKSFRSRFSAFDKALFVDSVKDSAVSLQLSNIIGFDFLPQIGANVYDIMKKEKLILSVSAVKALEWRLS
jgi:large subunit ribosomal protein L4